MHFSSIIGFSIAVSAQLATYTGCHNHSTVEYCYGADGRESAVWTYATITSTASIPASVSVSATITGQTTAVTGCHSHDHSVYCINGNGAEVLVSLTATPTGEMPTQYTGCHSHGSEQYCMDAKGNDVAIIAEGQTSGEGSGEMDCHFHAGVEHCVPISGTEVTRDCDARQRDFNMGLRVGTLFVVLVTSCCGVFAPLIMVKLPFVQMNGIVFTVIKQFGTGVIVSTAFVHLYTHAYLMFSNECLGHLQYEATTSAIVMAGIFLAWLIEYAGHQIVKPSTQVLPTKEATTTITDLGHHHSDGSKLSVVVMEAGILFHSILIGITLVVAGDSFYKTLLVVVVFHQFFEGLSLGARITILPGPILWQKFAMGVTFGLVIPLGMAIGLGVLQKFNGNDSSTIVTIGTLNALSAGILIWVGVVDMWARDWIIEGGDLTHGSKLKIVGGAFGLISGLVLMSLLGNWV